MIFSTLGLVEALLLLLLFNLIWHLERKKLVKSTANSKFMLKLQNLSWTRFSTCEVHGIRIAWLTTISHSFDIRWTPHLSTTTPLVILTDSSTTSPPSIAHGSRLNVT